MRATILVRPKPGILDPQGEAVQSSLRQLGFHVDVDNRMGDTFRNVQTTPPGSGCSVTFGTGLTPGLQLCVADIQAAHAELAGRGVDVSSIQHIDDNGWQDGPGGPWNSFFFFKDPDGNNWAVQEKPGV